MRKVISNFIVVAFVLSIFSTVSAEPFPRSWLWTSGPIKMVDTSKYKKEGPYKIGFSNASISNSWRVLFERQVKAEAEKHPEIEALYVTDANDKPDKQVADVEDLLAKGIDLLILSAATSAALDPIARRTMKKGIPVVCVDRDVKNPESYVTFVTSSNWTQGRVQMLWLCEMLGGKGNIVILPGIAGAAPAEQRTGGGLEVLTRFPDIKVLDTQYTGWSPAEGKKIMKALIQTYGDKINGVFGDGLQTSGAMEALKEAGIKIPITGDHLNSFLVRAQEWGYPAVSIDFPVSMGGDAVLVALKVLNGESVPKIIDVPRTIITTQDTENIKSDMPWSDMAHPEWPDGMWNNTLPEKWMPK